MSLVLLTRDPIDPEATRKTLEDPTLGGLTMFIGEVRSLTGSKETSKLVYSAYEEMALAQMKRIAQEAEEKWSARVAMIHRLGELFPGDIAVLAAAACAHREEAFACCRHLIETLKFDVPIWKQEFGPDGVAWIEGDSRVME
ncbi:MAG: molybdenum cofactor biosynthesis protein MoaE [Armatimonadetes bacterium]|nr:molybdenum cofactor biosynthesis protein MoaE [Armatimonadota bacterium]NOG93132.1 molybdenum cofactor biosynthesis protein MoaE [Armatimonadota bacterium]